MRTQSSSVGKLILSVNPFLLSSSFLVLLSGPSCGTDPDRFGKNLGQQAQALGNWDAAIAAAWCNGITDPSSVPGCNAQNYDGALPRAAELYAELRREYDNTLSPSHYQTSDLYVNESTGERDLDCSSFIDYGMAKTMVDGLGTLKMQYSSTLRPQAADFYDWIAGENGVTTPAWVTPIQNANDLQQGDLIALKYDGGCSSTGHVMMVNGAPQPGRSSFAEVLVSVTDATDLPHADDIRPGGYSGIGQGTIGLQLDPNGGFLGYFVKGGIDTSVYSRCDILGFAIGRLRDDSTCTAATCETLGASCGAADDGCGGALDCGACPSGTTCANGSCVSQSCNVTATLLFGPDTSHGETHLKLTNSGQGATTATAQAMTGSGRWAHVYNWTWGNYPTTNGRPAAVVPHNTLVTITSDGAIAAGATQNLVFDSDGNFGNWTVTCP